MVANGNPALRQTWQQVLEQVAAPLGVVLHPRASVSARAQIGPGFVVLAGAVVNAYPFLHTGVLVNGGAVVDHDATCAAYSQLGVNDAMALLPVWVLAKCSAAVKPALAPWNYRTVRRSLPRG